MKRTVEVMIMGQKFMVRSDSDDTYVQQIADFVNNKITEISSKTKSIPSLNVVILAAMNIADELLRDKDKNEKVFSGIEDRVNSMIELIDLQL